MTTEEKRHLQLIPAGVQNRMESSALADGVNIPEKTYWDFWYEKNIFVEVILSQ